MAKSPKIYANIKSIKEAYGDVWGTSNTDYLSKCALCLKHLMYRH